MAENKGHGFIGAPRPATEASSAADGAIIKRLATPYHISRLPLRMTASHNV